MAATSDAMKNRTYVLHCDKHGQYVSKSNRTKCPACIKEQSQLECEICHEMYEETRRLDLLHVHICDKCRSNLPGQGKKVLKCNIHGYYMGGSTDACPICYPRNPVVECEVCGKSYVDERRLDQIYGVDSPIFVCSECMNALPKAFDESDMFNNDGKRKPVYTMKCDAGHIYLSLSPRTYCPACMAENAKSRAVKMHDELLADPCNWLENVNGKLLILEPLQEHVKSYNGCGERECTICNRLFMQSSPSQKQCMRCHIMQTCEVCGLNFVTSDNHESFVCSLSCNTSRQHKTGALNPLKNAVNMKELMQDVDLSSAFDSLGDVQKLDITINEQNVVELQARYEYAFMLSGDGNKKPSFIWCKYDSNGKCLDVCLTNDLVGEFRYHVQHLESGHPQKFAMMKKHGNIVCKLLYVVSNWNDGLLLEMKHALEHGALYWSPAPGIQKRMLNKFNKGEGNT